ncbi:MAG: hypothetical protein KIT31_36820 [Deltaproteobacteria bacterium]|nr:hypothetical protein [Deltaproteobacteria bacterium]
MRRVALIVAGVIGLWIAVLVAAGALYAGRAADQVGERLAESIQGTYRVGDSSLALVRGRFALSDLHVGRDDEVGRLSLDVRDVACDLPPLGLAAVMRVCRTLEVSGVDLEVSTIALFQLKKPRRPPLRADAIVVDDAKIALAPSALLPGSGAIGVAIVHAEAGPTRLVTPLSWLFALRAMDAQLSLPAGIAIRLTYRDGMLAAQGSLFGARPVRVPISIPPADEHADARTQLRTLARLGVTVATQLVAARAKDWLRDQLGL